ncbi:co-chaperone YbbN [Nocardioides sp.]|uniref:thioredoxin family protein n=1 Tax=Nocardioides sp. TaxID=35761 RepID=UPI002721025C|nr:thioredoxin family protein [Nocardioides sp.]MDO9457784.1 thioredoxin family protein [Nocardioides sp.]
MTLGLVRPTTDDDFTDVVLGAAGPVLVAFHAGASAPPYVDDLAYDAPWLTCVRLDADRWPRTPAAYRVLRLPTVLVFAGGEPVLTLDGGQPLVTVRRLLDALR